MLPLWDENPTRRRSYVTIALILVNVGLFALVQQQQPQIEAVPVSVEIDGGGQLGTVRLDGQSAFDLEHAAIPCEVVANEPLSTGEVLVMLAQGDETACNRDVGAPDPLFPDKQVWFSVVLSTFLHTGWLHLLSNMLFLWIFGNNIEDHLGRPLYVLFYVLGGLVATFAHVLAGVDSTVPVLGASGAIAAVMGAYVVWYPNARILSLLGFIPLFVKAKWWLAAWFVLQFFTASDTAVAWVAHVGGFAFGVVMAALIRLSDRGREMVGLGPAVD